MFLRQFYLCMAYILFILKVSLLYSPFSLHLCRLLVIFLALLFRFITTVGSAKFRLGWVFYWKPWSCRYNEVDFIFHLI